MPSDRPWSAIPPRIGELLRPHLPALADEVIEAIRERVPAYRRPLRGRFGAGIRIGVEEALGQFADLISDPDLDRSGGERVYRGLGRGEHRERRSLDALLAAYRLGARVSWRRVAEIAIDAGVDRRTLALLAEAVFAYIDELSALSAEGYAEEQSVAAGEPQRRRRRLAELLLEPDPDEDSVRDAAADAGWEPPATLAALVWREGGRRAPGATAGRRRSWSRTRARRRGRRCSPTPTRRGSGRAWSAPATRPLRRSARRWRCSRPRPAPQRATSLLDADRRRGGRGTRAWCSASDHLASLAVHGDPAVLRDLAAQPPRAARAGDPRLARGG